MLSLTTRFALLMIVAVIGVVVLATFVTTSVLRGPHIGPLERSMADKALIIARTLKQSPDDARRVGVEIGPLPPDVRIDHHRTHVLNWLIRRRSTDVRVRVIETPDGSGKRMAVRIGPGQWAFAIYPTPPAVPIKPLVFYLSLVAIGVTLIAVYAANMMTRPLRMLDSTVARLGPDGTLPQIEEKGAPEIRATAKAINRLSARLNAAMESRMRLVAAAGHDLRTPMTRMRLRAEFLDEEERAAWLKDIDELDRIADSAIRLVREEDSSDPKETVALDGLVKDVTTELAELGLPVEAGQVAPFSILAAPFALKRAIRNLVTNAATHGGGARVELCSSGSGCVAVIDDDGPGIPAALMDRVFEPFFRVDEGRRQFFPGAGLGLAIAREIIVRNGGELAIENRPTGGLRQTIRFATLVGPT